MLNHLTKFITIILLLIYPMISSSTTTTESSTSTSTYPLPSLSEDLLGSPSDILPPPSDPLDSPSYLLPPPEDEDGEDENDDHDIIINGPNYIPSSLPNHTITIEEECSSAYHTILIFPSNVDWNINSRAYKYNKAFTCEDEHFSFIGGVILPPGEYTLLTANQGERGAWYNAEIWETFMVE